MLGHVAHEEVADLEQRHPNVIVNRDCFDLHALIIQHVSRQAAFTSLPRTGNKSTRLRQQFFQRRHCRFLGLQERPNSDLNFRCILFIKRTCQEACEVAEETEMQDELCNSVLQEQTDGFPVSQEHGF